MKKSLSTSIAFGFILMSIQTALSSTCLEEHNTPGCDDPTCQAIVCKMDPFCCNYDNGWWYLEGAWDKLCVEQAEKSCSLTPATPMSLKSAKITRDTNHPDNDSAVFNMRDMAGLAEVTQEAPYDLTLSFGTDQDCKAYEHTVSITDNHVTSKKLYYEEPDNFKVTCSLPKSLCKVVVQNANFEGECLSEDMTVTLQVGETTFQHFDIWGNSASSVVERYTYPDDIE